MADASLAQATKHIGIAIKLKRIVRERLPDCSVYLATYTTRRGYQEVEEQRGEEFWSIRAFSSPVPSPDSRAKDPDALITCGDRVRFLVEIRWGAMRGGNKTDLPRTQVEWLNLGGALRASQSVRVRGPAVKAGVRYASATFPESKDYVVDSDTRSVLVADFCMAKMLLPGLYEDALSTWRQARSDPALADIEAGVDEIPSLRELLAR